LDRSKVKNTKRSTLILQIGGLGDGLALHYLGKTTIATKSQLKGEMLGARTNIHIHIDTVVLW
jgi:hypothetical protein